MKTAATIHKYIAEQLVMLIEVKTAKWGEDELWRTGVPGAMLEGRIDMLLELLEWIDAD
jgi:hypothetical protein